MAKLIAAGVLMPGAVACEVLSVDGDRALPISGREALGVLGQMERRVMRDRMLCELLEPRGCVLDAIVEDGLCSARDNLVEAENALMVAEREYRRAFQEHGWKMPLDNLEVRQMMLAREMVCGMLERCPVEDAV
jgi:hypothetical protein